MFRHKLKYLVASGLVLVLALMIALAAVGLTRMAATNHRLEIITNTYNVKTDIIFSLRHNFVARHWPSHLTGLAVAKRQDRKQGHGCGFNS